MKTWHLFVSIVVILAIVCSPALAISKSELISQYKTGNFPGPTTPTPIPTVIPTTGPTNIPTGAGTGALFVNSYPCDADVYLDGELKGGTPCPQRPRSFAVPLSDDYDPNAYTLTGIPVGTHQLKVTKEGFQDYITGVTVTAGETTHVSVNLWQKPPNPTPTVIPTAMPTPAPSNRPYSIVPDIYIKTKSSYHDSLSEIFAKKWPEMIFSDDTAVSGKPNIYLYSDQDLTVRVRLAPEYAITISDPVYRPGIERDGGIH